MSQIHGAPVETRAAKDAVSVARQQLDHVPQISLHRLPIRTRCSSSTASQATSSTTCQASGSTWCSNANAGKATSQATGHSSTAGHGQQLDHVQHRDRRPPAQPPEAPPILTTLVVFFILIKLLSQ